jgi:hypothetical protein
VGAAWKLQRGTRRGRHRTNAQKRKRAKKRKLAARRRWLDEWRRAVADATVREVM